VEVLVDSALLFLLKKGTNQLTLLFMKNIKKLVITMREDDVQKLIQLQKNGLNGFLKEKAFLTI